jgi:hypothetical protein
MPNRTGANAVQITLNRLMMPAVATFAALSASPGSAQVDSLSSCLAILDVNARVACYDALARAEQSVQSEVSEESAPPNTTTAGPEAPSNPTPRAEFGLSAAEREQRRPAQQQQLESLAVQVSSARVVGPGYWRFTMDDGSTWQLAEVLRSFRPPRSGDAAIIRRGSLGSYLLEADGQPGIRIKRLN